MKTLDELLNIARISIGPLYLYKVKVCYYSNCEKSPKLYLGNFIEEKERFFCFCNMCAERNSHLNLKELDTKELFVLQLNDYI